MLTDDELPADVRAVIEAGAAELAAEKAADDERRAAELAAAAARRLGLLADARALLVGAGLPAALAGYVVLGEDYSPGLVRAGVELPGCVPVLLECQLSAEAGARLAVWPGALWQVVPAGRSHPLLHANFARAAAAARAAHLAEIPF